MWEPQTQMKTTRDRLRTINNNLSFLEILFAMKKTLSLIVLAAFSLVGIAQNNVVYKADNLLQQNKPAEALEILKTSFNNPKTTKFGEIYNKAGRCSALLFNPELMKAAKQQPLDTAKFIQYLDDMVNYYTKSYVAEHTPNEKGKLPKPEFSADDTKMLYDFRDYFFYAGIFLNSNGNKSGAYDYFGRHLAFPDNPALESKRDSMLTTMATNYAQTTYYRAMLANELKDYTGVLSNVEAAFKFKKSDLDSAKVSIRDLYIMKLQAIMEGSHDTIAYVNALKDAIMNLDDNTSFMESLISIYYQNNDVKAAEQTAQEIIAKNPGSKSAWYIKGCVDLNLKRDYEGARKDFDEVLKIDPNFIEANANMAYSYINDVISKKQSGRYKYAGGNLSRVKGQKAVELYNKELKEIKSYYEKAQPYMEKVRALAPDRVKIWAPSLQQIYFNLGRKAEANQMDDILRASNHQ